MDLGNSTQSLSCFSLSPSRFLATQDQVEPPRPSSPDTLALPPAVRPQVGGIGLVPVPQWREMGRKLLPRDASTAFGIVGFGEVAFKLPLYLCRKKGSDAGIRCRGLGSWVGSPRCPNCEVSTPPCPGPTRGAPREGKAEAAAVAPGLKFPPLCRAPGPRLPPQLVHG